MLTKRLLLSLVAVLVLALVAVGCGSDKKESSKSKPAITKAEFLRKGNAICTAGNKQIDAKGKKFFAGQKSKPSEAQLKKFATEVLIPNVQQQVDGIRALGSPPGDKAKVKAILDAADQGLAKSKQDPAAIASEGSQDPFARANKLAREYGLKVCGSG